ncbi:MAG: chloramphenicol phosphotransferase CPT family protein [Clostridiales bacterium]|nr:chloramphenicol phosphotransferase CPT family protein [Clostridiales bacterium]
MYETADHTAERSIQQLKKKLSSAHMLMVRVSCSLSLLRKRELERADRSPGSAEASAKYLFPKEGYDLAVDTGIRSPAENSRMILDSLF